VTLPAEPAGWPAELWWAIMHCTALHRNAMQCFGRPSVLLDPPRVKNTGLARLLVTWLVANILTPVSTNVG
jgi:hypothetical protein